MAAGDRELSISYANLVIGGVAGTQAGFHLDGRYRLEKGPDEAAVEFDFIVQGDTEASFAQAVAAAEAAFRKPYQSCVVALGSQVLERFTHGSDKGFDARPTLSKRGEDAADTGRSRRYTARIEFGMPADNTPTTGLRDLATELIYLPSRRRRLVLRGTYTAVDGTNARTMYDNGIAALATAALSALGVSVSELTEETAGPESMTGKVFEFERTYEEIIYGQGATAVTDDADLVRQQLSIARRDRAEDDSVDGVSGFASGFASAGTTDPGTKDKVRRLQVIDLIYEVWVDSSSTTDLQGKYDTLRPWLLQRLRDEFPGGGALALVEERPELFRDDNRIRATMTALVVVEGATFFSRTLTVEDVRDPGIVLVPAWTGNAMSKYDYQGPATIRRIFTDVKRVQGKTSPVAAAGQAETIASSLSQAPYGGESGNSWITVRQSSSVTPLRLGFGENTIEASDVTVVVEREFYRSISPGAGTGGGGSGTQPTPGAGQGIAQGLAAQARRAGEP